MTSYILKTQFDLMALASKGYFKLLPLRPTQKLEDLSSELTICTHNGDGNTYRNKISSNNNSIWIIQSKNSSAIAVKSNHQTFNFRSMILAYGLLWTGLLRIYSSYPLPHPQNSRPQISRPQKSVGKYHTF
jgi:hypothetical protein